MCVIWHSTKKYNRKYIIIRDKHCKQSPWVMDHIATRRPSLSFPLYALLCFFFFFPSRSFCIVLANNEAIQWYGRSTRNWYKIQNVRSECSPTTWNWVNLSQKWKINGERYRCVYLSRSLFITNHFCRVPFVAIVVSCFHLISLTQIVFVLLFLFTILLCFYVSQVEKNWPRHRQSLVFFPIWLHRLMIVVGCVCSVAPSTAE